MLSRRRIGTGLAIVAGLLALAQAVPVERRNPPVVGEVPASAEVRVLLRRACYDCHSNETVWPWYARVAPMSWLVAHDVTDGRDSVNFSAWTAYGPARRAKLLRESADEIAEGEMPPWYYRLVHPEARLTRDELATLRAWASGAAGP
jgi:hypothetical protein